MTNIITQLVFEFLQHFRCSNCTSIEKGNNLWKKSSYERTDLQTHVQNPHSNQELHNSCKQIVRTGQVWLVAGISQKKWTG